MLVVLLLSLRICLLCLESASLVWQELCPRLLAPTVPAWDLGLVPKTCLGRWRQRCPGAGILSFLVEARHHPQHLLCRVAGTVAAAVVSRASAGDYRLDHFGLGVLSLPLLLSPQLSCASCPATPRSCLMSY